MATGWQDIIALGVVAAAAAYLVRAVWRMTVKRRGGACGGCASCPASTSPASKTIISVDSLTNTSTKRLT